MMSERRFGFTLVILLCLFRLSGAQEILIGLTSNGIIRYQHGLQQDQPVMKSKQAGDTLELPFFDDFSRYTVYPDPARWEDRYAFVNFSYGVRPVSIGVATLDAIDDKGTLYSHATTTGFPADHLTSRPVNLNYPPSQNIFLSFFYQPQGIGDPPAPGDSLVLEFYSVSDSAWYSVWRSPGDTLYDFRQVIIPVNNPIFLKRGFRFRFTNYASLSSNAGSPGMIGNCDHWHLDYIRLDRNRSPDDTVLNDVAMVKPIVSLLKNHESMPWDHFRAIFLSEMGNTIPISYTNHDDSIRNVTRLFEITDVYENKLAHSYSAGASNIDPAETIHYTNPSLFYTYNSPRTDSVLFRVRSHLITDDFDNKVNDTVIYYQRFADYFAYDDGSSEAGYGFTGQGAENARIAYQFSSYIPDTLYAVRIFFNQSFNDASQRYFTLTLWGDNNGKPGDILYSQPGEEPRYAPDLTGFHTYSLNTPQFVSGKFYVGWQQVTDAFLNFGFDLNRVRNNRIFFHQNGQWFNSQFPGALMIRPVMGKEISTYRKPVYNELPLRLFPNPANEYIRIDYPIGFSGANSGIVLYDSFGRKVFYSPEPQPVIDLSGFSPGLYILAIQKDGTVIATRKFIISR